MNRLVTVMLVIAVALPLTTCRLDQLISPPPAGTLVVSSGEIVDSAAVGSMLPRALTLSLSNPGERQQSWSATHAQGGTWLELDPTSGTAPSSLTVTLDPAGLSRRVYRDTIVFAGGSGETEPTRVPVQFTSHACLSKPLAKDTVIVDSLTTADCVAPHRADHYARVIRFDANQGDSVSVWMESGDFDSYLVLDSVAQGTASALAESGSCQGEAGNPCLRYVLLPASGSYFIEATTSEGRYTGAFTLEIRPPRAPSGPTGLAQYRSDSATTMVLGATVNDTAAVFQGSVTDPDLGDSLRLQVEVQPVESGFTGFPTDSSAWGASGETLTVAVVGLVDDTRYHWQARAIDETGRSGVWVSFGGNGELEPDFAIATQEVPASPTGLGQFRSDATTRIAIGGTTQEPTVVLAGSVSDPDPTDRLRLEVEVRPIGTAFTDSPTGSSVLVPSGTDALATITGLADNTSYHWQARTVDEGGDASTWVAFGGNPETETDFSVSVPGGAGTPQTPRQLKGDSVTPIPLGTTTDEATLVFTASMTDPDPGDQVKLEVEVKPLSQAFDEQFTKTSQLVTNGAIAYVRFTDLNDDTDYHWRARAVDGGGSIGAWVSFGANPDAEVDFRVAVPASQLVFTAPPRNTVAGRAMDPPVVVTAQEPSGQTDTSFVQDISITITAGTGASGAVLSGTRTVTALGGVATFSDLSIDLAGSGYSFTAMTSGLTTEVSSTFDIVPAGSNTLKLVIEPSTTAQVAVPFAQQPAIQLVDDNGNDVSQSGVVVTADVASGPSGATLTSATATTNASGRATFSGLGIVGTVGSYVLDFTSEDLIGVPSSPITLSLGSADAGNTTATVPPGTAGS